MPRILFSTVKLLTVKVFSVLFFQKKKVFIHLSLIKASSESKMFKSIEEKMATASHPFPGVFSSRTTETPDTCYKRTIVLRPGK